MNNQTITLYKMGNDFNHTDDIISDLENYRLRVIDLETKDNMIITGDFSKYGGDSYKMSFDLEYRFSNGCAYRYKNDNLTNYNYQYFKKDLLKAINSISKKQYKYIKIENYNHQDDNKLNLKDEKLLKTVNTAIKLLNKGI